MPNEPRNHHYVPQFYLRNFSIDDQRLKIPVVTKEKDRAIWAIRSIESGGRELDLYVHISRGRPVSVETSINRMVETPLSQTETWAKIAGGMSNALDGSDKAVLYALIRNLRSRTPYPSGDDRLVGFPLKVMLHS